MDIAETNLVTGYHSLTQLQIETASTTRNDPRAIQNARPMYSCLESSISSDLKATLFSQDGKLPSDEGGNFLFAQLTTFTMSASLKLSMDSFKRILEFDPAIYSFNISSVNTKLNHQFVLATTGQRILGELYCIQHTITDYSCIKQPEEWAQWIHLQIDRFEEDPVVNSQSFMNSTALKYIKISASESGFGGSSTTISEYILYMMASVSNKHSSPITNKPVVTDKSSTKTAKTLPPFVRHFKATNASDAAVFEIGDSKEWKGETNMTALT